MRKMNLARAMKEKKRIIARINEISEQIRTSNVYFVDEKPDLDLVARYSEFEILRDHLVELKNKLAIANADNGISEKIYTMEECKSELALWNKTNTDTTPERRIDYDTKALVIREKDAFFTFKKVDSIKNSLREKIELLQDEIDDMNAKTFIEISF